MTTLAGIIIPWLLVIILGKHMQRVRKSGYVLVLMFALIQVGIVLVDMFTLKNPLE